MWIFIALLGGLYRLAQHGKRWIEFTPLAVIDDLAKHIPNVALDFKTIGAVSQDMDDLDDAPSLQLVQADADRRAGDRKRLADFFRIERFGAQIKQAMDLGHGTVDAPALTHFAPMDNETLFCRS